jgi:hypothetical protein
VYQLEQKCLQQTLTMKKVLHVQTLREYFCNTTELHGSNYKGIMGIYINIKLTL